MLRFIIFRILLIFPILLIASFVIFLLLRLSGTDPVEQYIINSKLQSSPALVQELRVPLLEQYGIWLKNAVALDFGKSYMTDRDVADDFLAFMPNTLLLTFFAFSLTLLVSIPLGILSFIYRGKWLDYIIRFFCFLGVSVPNFWLAFLLIMLFSLKLDWLPPLGDDSLSSFVLPSISIAIMSLCINIRLIRTNMLEISKSRHIMYAKMRGLSKTKIAIKHIFYNATLPIVTALGMHVGELIGGALVIESIFALPGIGYYSIQGIANHDYPIIECFVVSMCAIFCVFNLLVDILYACLNPKVRYEYANRNKS